MRKQRIKLSAKKTAILITIICTAGAIALAVSIMLSPPIPAAQVSRVIAGQSVPEKPQADSVLSVPGTPPVQAVPVSGVREEPEENPVEKPVQKPPQKPSQSQKSVPPQPPAAKKPAAKPKLLPSEEHRTPLIPKPQEKLPELPIQPQKVTGKLIVVFDDAGYNMQQLQKVVDLPFPVTVAVLPGLDYSVQAAKLVRSAGKELILHQPMQAKNLAVNPGPGAILPGMSVSEATEVVLKNLAAIAPVKGLNNHEGSLITESELYMDAVLEVCVAEKIYFLDSRTTAQSAAPVSAKKRGMKIWERAIFLDNSQARADMEKMLAAGVKAAEQNGYAVLIGHVWANELAALLRDVYPALTEQGFVFTTISQLK